MPAVSSHQYRPSTTPSTRALALGWSPIGGPYGSDPTTLPTKHLVFAVGQAGDPYFHEVINGQWSAARALGGQLESVIAPAEAILEPQPDGFEIFGVGVDGSMWYSTRTPGWQPFGGAFISSPASVRYQGVTYVFGVGLDGSVWYRSAASGWISLGGQIISDLAITADGSNLYVLGLGGDSAMWVQQLRPNLTWSGWGSLGGMLDSYATTTYDANTGYFFAVGTDGSVWYQSVTNGRWSGWYTLGGLAESAPAAIARAGVLDVFVLGGSLEMWSRRYTNASGWSGWRNDGGQFDSNPAATTSHVFANGLDGRLYAAFIG